MKKLEEEICSGAKRRSPERAETREVFEPERVVSCRSRNHRWRTKLDFSGEPFDDLHWSTAFRAAPKTGRVFGGGSVLFSLRFLCGTEQLEAKRQEAGLKKPSVKRRNRWDDDGKTNDAVRAILRQR